MNSIYLIQRLAKCLAILVFNVAFLTFSYSQSVPNPGFEKWVNYSGTVLEVPEHWTTNDLLYKHFDEGYKGVTVTKTTHSHSGKYALQMNVAISHGDTVNGGIYSTGSVDSLLHVIYQKSIAGFKCGNKYGSFSGYYIFDCKGGDTAIFGVDLTRWNKQKRKRDTLVNATLRIGQNAMDYVPFVMPLKYRISDELPDTALIVIGIQGEYGKPAHLGTSLLIDDLSLSGLSMSMKSEK